ncbi:hypothetical protein N7495_000038 [Penicillium taxi]|uniref:uncharacterized protein n=1 Tax=Penicillium taxi TaxID=168475 RepID=UPI0025452578|nr:uncharacterized protein N7495_000038 [Penicillium taxi]KAJ5907356.1 hypothetical protein N7495_000038 [Penicillium taxi]
MAPPNDFEPYLLSPLDYVPVAVHMTAFLTFRLDNPARAIPVLEAGVACLTSHLPFLTGNVAASSLWPDKQNMMEVQPSNQDSLDQYPMLKIKYHHRRWDTEFYDPEYLPLALDSIINERSPVFRLQANILEDGIILCAAFHHMTMDATGFYNVMEALSISCRSPETLAERTTSPIEESLTRKKILNAVSIVPVVKSEEKNEGESSPEVPVDLIAEVLVSHKFVLCNEKINRLRKLCISLTNPPTKLSRNDVVSSIIWLCFMRARALLSPSAAEDKSRLLTAADVRRTLSSVLPQTYLGNCLQGISVHSPFPLKALLEVLPRDQNDSITRLKKTDIHFLAKLSVIHRQQFVAIDDKVVRNTISQITNTKDWASNRSVVGGLGDLTLSNIRNLGFYNLDFGSVLGTIHDFDSPDPRNKGLTWALPARFGDAPWEIRLPLDSKIMELMQRDPLMCWLEYKEVAKL